MSWYDPVAQLALSTSRQQKYASYDPHKTLADIAIIAITLSLLLVSLLLTVEVTLLMHLGTLWNARRKWWLTSLATSKFQMLSALKKAALSASMTLGPMKIPLLAPISIRHLLETLGVSATLLWSALGLVVTFLCQNILPQTLIWSTKSSFLGISAM